MQKFLCILCNSRRLVWFIFVFNKILLVISGWYVGLVAGFSAWLSCGFVQCCFPHANKELNHQFLAYSAWCTITGPEAESLGWRVRGSAVKSTHCCGELGSIPSTHMEVHHSAALVPGELTPYVPEGSCTHTVRIYSGTHTYTHVI